MVKQSTATHAGRGTLVTMNLLCSPAFAHTHTHTHTHTPQYARIAMSVNCDAGADINSLLTMKTGAVPCKAVWRLRRNKRLVKNATEPVQAKSISLLKYMPVGKLYVTKWVSAARRRAPLRM